MRAYDKRIVRILKEPKHEDLPEIVSLIDGLQLNATDESIQYMLELIAQSIAILWFECNAKLMHLEEQYGVDNQLYQDHLELGEAILNAKGSLDIVRDGILNC